MTVRFIRYAEFTPYFPLSYSPPPVRSSQRIGMGWVILQDKSKASWRAGRVARAGSVRGAGRARTLGAFAPLRETDPFDFAQDMSFDVAQESPFDRLRTDPVGVRLSLQKGAKKLTKWVIFITLTKVRPRTKNPAGSLRQGSCPTHRSGRLAMDVVDHILGAIGRRLDVLAGAADGVAGRKRKRAADDGDRGEFLDHLIISYVA